MRASGMLLPIASLPSKYGIGTFSREAYEFVDTLKKARQRYWQILPLGPTGYGDSPYQSFSTFAGNPYFIDLEQLIKEGRLTPAECESYDFGDNPSYIDYEKIYLSRFKVLRLAFQRMNPEQDKRFKKFCHAQRHWLHDYALYMAVKDSYGGKCWTEWEEGIRLRETEAIREYEIKLKADISFYKYLQYEFYRQWNKLKKYANKNGVRIIGDIPIYVAFDSADTWANPKLFHLDEKNLPVAVAGCPPDAFSATGQLWGNPLYQWQYHKETGYEWWIDRIKHCFTLYDVVRIDHFRGFDEYYAIPYGDKTAENGEWEQGPGLEFFQVVEKRLGKLDIIAEDLGFLTDSVRKLLKDSKFPGMKVLQFAFDSREQSDYLPHNYGHNCVVYTGTHDNNTLVGWYQEISKADRKMANRYVNNWEEPRKELHWDIMTLALASTADRCIIPVQDYLDLGEEARINTPSTLGDNWKWRMDQDAFTKKRVKKIKKMMRLYGRG